MMHESQQITQSAVAEENDSLISETFDALPNRKPASIGDTGQGQSSNQTHAASNLKALTKIARKNGRRYLATLPSLLWFRKIAKLHSTNFKVPAIAKQDGIMLGDELLQIKRPLRSNESTAN